METWDAVVIGGGQAGLAMGHHLARRGLRFVVLDASPSVGHAWRARWDSLRLFTPARYSALPGLPFPGDPDAYPHRDEVAAYLEAYAEAFALPVRLDSRVTALRHGPGGRGYVVETARGSHAAPHVVVATGPFARPAIPALSASLSPDVVQLHSAQYRNPAQLPDGPVLVVGAGNSGVQIAEELAASRPVTIAVGERLPRLPQTLLGRPIFWWLERAGAMELDRDSWLGRRMRGREALIGEGLPALAKRGVRVAGRVVAAEGGRVTTAGGDTTEPAAVVWATGYRGDYRWIDVPVIGRDGMPEHRHGVTAAPGLSFLGLPWQRTRGSALLGWVGRDAALLAERISPAPRPVSVPVSAPMARPAAAGRG